MWIFLLKNFSPIYRNLTRQARVVRREIRLEENFVKFYLAGSACFLSLILDVEVVCKVKALFFISRFNVKVIAEISHLRIFIIDGCPVEIVKIVANKSRFNFLKFATHLFFLIVLEIKLIFAATRENLNLSKEAFIFRRWFWFALRHSLACGSAHFLGSRYKKNLKLIY